MSWGFQTLKSILNRKEVRIDVIIMKGRLKTVAKLWSPKSGMAQGS